MNWRAASAVLCQILAISAKVHAHNGHEGEHGCGGNHKRQVPAGLSPPSRPLEWGDINILHTTDTHGWLLGHQKSSFPEPNYSGDFGDYSSFVSHMKEQAKKRGVDLLLVDSGDLHDGTGLVDGFPAGGVDAQDANNFFTQLPYDVMAIGNHELYIYQNTLDMHQNFAPKLKGRYISSNVNITLPNEKGIFTSVPVGSRFAKFKTTMGRQVTALGVLFNFEWNARNTTIQRVEDMVNEAWFKEAILDEPDVFILAGHMPVVKDRWPLVFNAIRALHPTTPIVILGGHSHIRNCVQLDGRSMSLQSGRYMETLGWMSVKLDEKGSTRDLSFSRRYLDPNLATYQFHTGLGPDSFGTTTGNAITTGLKQLAESFNLGFMFGTSPDDFTLNRVPHTANNSLLTLFTQAASVALAQNNTRASIPNVIVLPSGTTRFDVYSGNFDRNDQFTTAPFVNKFLYIGNLTLSSVREVLFILNRDGQSNFNLGQSGSGQTVLRAEYDHDYAAGNVEPTYRSWLSDMSQTANNQATVADARTPTLGYVTTDSCPGIGDDIPHTPLPFYDIPDFISTPIPDLPDHVRVDFVFLDFIRAQVVDVVNEVQTDRWYTLADLKKYSSVLSNEVFGVFAKEKWN